MISRGKRSILGVGVNVVDYDGAIEAIISAAKDHRPFAVSALAVHGVMTGFMNPEHKFRLNRLDLVTPDGQPVRWALGLLHREWLPDRVYGPELTSRLCRLAGELGLRVFLYGSRPEVLAAWHRRMSEFAPGLGIAGTEPSKFRTLSETEAQELNVRILASSADIVLVGLGCPRQEVFAYEHAAALSRPILAVGAAFDFGAGVLPQAPRWMQRSGLEWLFRLATEPRRLWRRYVLLNPLYCVLVAIQALFGSRLFSDEQPPAGPVRYG